MIPDEMLQDMPGILLRNLLKKKKILRDRIKLLVELKEKDIHSEALTTSKGWEKVQLFVHGYFNRVKRGYFPAEQAGTLTPTYTCHRHVYTNWEHEVHFPAL